MKGKIGEKDYETTSDEKGSLPPRYVVLGMILILAVAAYILWAWYIPCSGGGVDESTYLLGAKGIARHLDPVYRNPDPQQFVPEMMIETEPGVFYPVYPIGYPILAAIGYKLGGPEGAFVVNPVLVEPCV
jgi:hypothetical protein